MEYKMKPLPEFDSGNAGSSKLLNKIAVVTGGDSGIGRAVAVAFAKEGADVAISYYEDDKESGSYKRFYLNGALREIGQNINDKEDGDWKYFTLNGTLIKECSYYGANLIGTYREYYTNGQIKVKGVYRQGEGIIKASSINAITGARRTYNRKILNKEYKTGKWTYYNSSGKIVKTEQFK